MPGDPGGLGGRTPTAVGIEIYAVCGDEYESIVRYCEIYDSKDVEWELIGELRDD